MRKLSQFEEKTHVWFDAISASSATNAHMPSFQQANIILQRIPNKRNLLKLIDLIESSLIKFVKEEAAWKAVLSQTRAIINGEFNEFRFRYNSVAPIKGQCSATSSLFSSLSQAINYNVADKITPKWYREGGNAFAGAKAQ